MKPENGAPTIIAGRKPVLDALAQADASIDVVYLRRDLKSAFAPQLRKACRAHGVAIKMVPQEKLDRLAGGAAHQGVVALTSAVKVMDLDDLLALVAPTWDDVQRLKPLLALPDQITDPHNLGAIVRSAAAFGCSGIVLPERNSAPLSAVAVKASAGTAMRMPFARVGNASQTIRRLKERGYWAVGLASEGSSRLADIDWERPIVLAIGSESEGLSELVARECDVLVSIPMATGVESLNASVAAGIALHAASRARLLDQ